MMKKIYLTLMTLIILSMALPMINSASIDEVERYECVELYQLCENCTYNNISTVLYPNKSIAVSNKNMTTSAARTTYYNYTFCDTDAMGIYTVNGFGDLDGVKTTWTYTFEVTGTGHKFTESESIFYVAMLGLLVFFFIVDLYAIGKLPKGNDTDDYGMVLGINKLKYLRPVLFFVAWGLLLSITFTSSNVAIAYIGGGLFGQLLFNLYRIMMVLTLPMFLVFFGFIFIQVFRDNEMKKLLERGIDIQSGYP